MNLNLQLKEKGRLVETTHGFGNPWEVKTTHGFGNPSTYSTGVKGKIKILY